MMNRLFDASDPAVRFQGSWYYLEADDLRSRNTFYLVRLIFSLQAPPPGGSETATFLVIGG